VLNKCCCIKLEGKAELKSLIGATTHCLACLVVLSFNFCLSVKRLISQPNLNKNLAGQSIFDCSFFPFITSNISYHSLLACRVSVEKSADNLMGVLLYVVCCFSLVAFSPKQNKSKEEHTETHNNQTEKN